MAKKSYSSWNFICARLLFALLVLLPSVIFADDARCDTSAIYPCSDNYVGIIMLILFYGAILAGGAKLISDGSELMLELFPKYGSVIGALLLPILGAVPDSLIIIFSGAFGTVEEAQDQVAVGVGTLAGSTILLLTAAWAASIFVGRCDMNSLGSAIDNQCNGFGLVRQGITVDEDTKMNARIMLITSLAYLIIQITAFFYLGDPSGESAKKVEHPAALVGFIVCCIFLVLYCAYQVIVPKLAEKRKEKLEKEREAKFLRLKALHVIQRMQSAGTKTPSEEKEKPAETKEALALNIGLKWKAKAKAINQKEEESQPLLETAAHEENTTAKQKEEEEAEEDPTKHFFRNFLKSLFLMLLGTGIVVFFSDPMVDQISAFSNKAGIKPFFISFLITPYCSNASELISSLIFASKKKVANASLTFGQLYGAATMNSTLCLGIFLALIAFRGLTWTFTAETLTILLITWIVGLIGSFKTDFRMYWALPVLFLYPFSLFFVWFLEAVAGWT